MADLFRKAKSLYSSTSSTFGTGEGVTITPASVSGLPTDTEIVLTFDRVDSGGTATPSKLERIKGTISGGNFVVASGGRGFDGTSEQAHTSPVVEFIPNAADINDLVDGITAEHNQDGSHSNITASIITADKITGTSQFPQVYGEHNNGNTASAITVNWLNGDRQFACVTASTTVAFSNAQAGQSLQLRTFHPASGYSVTLPTVKWPGGSVGNPTTSASAINLYVFYYDGAGYLAQLSAGFA